MENQVRRASTKRKVVVANKTSDVVLTNKTKNTVVVASNPRPVQRQQTSKEEANKAAYVRAYKRYLRRRAFKIILLIFAILAAICGFVIGMMCAVNLGWFSWKVEKHYDEYHDSVVSRSVCRDVVNKGEHELDKEYYKVSVDNDSIKIEKPFILSYYTMSYDKVSFHNEDDDWITIENGNGSDLELIGDDYKKVKALFDESSKIWVDIESGSKSYHFVVKSLSFFRFLYWCTF